MLAGVAVSVVATGSHVQIVGVGTVSAALIAGESVKKVRQAGEPATSELPPCCL